MCLSSGGVRTMRRTSRIAQRSARESLMSWRYGPSKSGGSVGTAVRSATRPREFGWLFAISTVAIEKSGDAQTREYLSHGCTVTCTSGSSPVACGERRKAPTLSPGDANTDGSPRSNRARWSAQCRCSCSATAAAAGERPGELVVAAAAGAGAAVIDASGTAAVVVVVVVAAAAVLVLVLVGKARVVPAARVEAAAHKVVAARRPLHDRVHAVGEAAADVRAVLDDVDAERLELRAVADAREEQQLWRVHRARRQDDLAPRAHARPRRVVRRVAPAHELDARRAPLIVEEDARHQRVRAHRHRRRFCPSADVGGGRRVAHAVADHELVEADAAAPRAVEVAVAVQPSGGARLDEGARDVVRVDGCDVHRPRRAVQLVVAQLLVVLRPQVEGQHVAPAPALAPRGKVLGPPAHVQHRVVHAAAAQPARLRRRRVGRDVPLELRRPAVVAQHLHPTERQIEDRPPTGDRLGAAVERALRPTARLEHEHRVARSAEPARHH